jgi:hypothetical protein
VPVGKVLGWRKWGWGSGGGGVEQDGDGVLNCSPQLSQVSRRR